MSAPPHTPGRRRAANTPPSGSGYFDTAGRKTLADQIYAQLHHDITHLILPPGTPVLEREIAAQFQASRTPVREAVLRLAKEMLVEVVPKSGTFVARIPLSVLPEALLARRALERDVAARAAQRASPAQILRLRAIVEEGREAALSDTQEAFDHTDSAFHAQLAEVAGFPGLWALIQQIKTPMDRFRHLSLPAAGRMEQVVHEHGAITDAIAASDAQRAAAEMDKHLQQLKHDTLKTLETYPNYFIVDIDPESLISD